MFKNYLTFQLAQSFDQVCRTSAVSAELKSRLTQSSERMLTDFAESLGEKDPAQEARLLLSALLSLRECRQILEEAGIRLLDLDGKFEILHRRLEQLAFSSTSGSGAQLRLFNGG